jgi:amidase/aspartyl-tRNA(Asn)/glutamyl-tRNA(Gln) amidotransferase subunit A
MARTVAEALDLYDVISQSDPRETYGFLPEAPLDAPFDPAGLRVGVLPDLGYGFPASAAVLAAVDDAAAAIAAAGAHVETIAPPFDADPYDPLDTLFLVRALTEWEALTPRQQALVHPVAAQWIRTGAAGLTATDYDRALNAVFASQSRFAAALRPYDLVLSPTRPVSSLPAEAVGLDPARPLADTGFTCWYNQTGQPAASICYGLENGHPIGLQIVGERFTDRMVMAAAAWFEAQRGFELDWPFEPRSLVSAVDTEGAAV